MLTAGEIWAAVAALTAVEGIVFFVVLSGIRDAYRDIIRDEKRRIRIAAQEEIEQKARERAQEILAETRLKIDVQLVNESDIPWGNDNR